MRFDVVALSPTDDFALVWIGYSTLTESKGYQQPIALLATVQQLLAPIVGAGYTTQTLPNGIVLFARGKPTIELFFVEGKMPSGSKTERSYDMGLLVFRPRAPVLELIDPCEWWTTTPPPGWTAQTQQGGCQYYWAQVKPHS